MLRLNTGFSRKIGEPNYSSRGASINLELELESHLIHDGDALTTRIRQLFDLARQAVDTELGLESVAPRRSRAVQDNDPAAHNGNSAPCARTGARPDRPAAGHHEPNAAADRPAGGYDNNGCRAPRPATSSQLRAIRSICRRLQLDPDRLAADRFDVDGLEDLTLPEASELIDGLKGAPTGAR